MRECVCVTNTLISFCFTFLLACRILCVNSYIYIFAAHTDDEVECCGTLVENYLRRTTDNMLASVGCNTVHIAQLQSLVKYMQSTRRVTELTTT